jgi:hypothetical protein
MNNREARRDAAVKLKGILIGIYHDGVFLLGAY